MIKKKITFFILLFSILVSSCGYTPQYAKNKNLDFSIEILGLSGDRDFNNSLDSKLKRYANINENQTKNFQINITSKYEKNTSLKDSAGTATEYELKITVNFKINYNDLEKNVSLKETFNMKKMDDSFEERNYEKTIKNNFADIIEEELIFYLTRL